MLVMGCEFDFFFDVIFFGVGLVVFGYVFGMYGFYDCIILCYFVVCGVFCLVCYNVMVEEFFDGSGKVKYFEGMLILILLLIVGLLFIVVMMGVVCEVIWFGELMLVGYKFYLFFLVFVFFGLLMISWIWIFKL